MKRVFKSVLFASLALCLFACGDDGSGGGNGETQAGGQAGPMGGQGGAAGQEADHRSVALAQVAGEASADQCANGGVVLELGVDLNANGVLDPDEVTGTEVICNGRDGMDGTDGMNGADGMDGAE